MQSLFPAKQQSSIKFSNFTREDVELYIQSLTVVDKLLKSSFDQHVPFAWLWIQEFFAVTSSIDDKFASIAIKKLNTTEQELYKFVRQWGRSTEGPNRSSFGQGISLNNIYFKISELKDLLTYLEQPVSNISDGEINLDQLARIRCFGSIITIYQFFNPWLITRNNQLLELLIKLRDQL
jgi:hypothetical protein